MTWEQVQTYLIGLAASAIVGLLGKWLGMKRAEETRSAVTWALEQAVALVAHKLGKEKGEVKQAEAIKVAESLAPKAMAKLPEKEKRVLVDAVYARMKASLPAPSMFSMRGEDIPVDVVELEARPTLPAKKAKPS